MYLFKFLIEKITGIKSGKISNYGKYHRICVWNRYIMWVNSLRGAIKDAMKIGDGKD